MPEEMNLSQPSGKGSCRGEEEATAHAPTLVFTCATQPRWAGASSGFDCASFSNSKPSAPCRSRTGRNPERSKAQGSPCPLPGLSRWPPPPSRHPGKIGRHLPAHWGEATEKSPPGLVTHGAKPKASSLWPGTLTTPPGVGSCTSGAKRAAGTI